MIATSRDRHILDAAALAFHEKGFHGVGVDEIGTRAGLSGPSLYRHFAGKDEILATLLNEAMDELLSATVAVHHDPARDLDRALRHHVAYAVNHRHLVGLYQREVRSLVDPWAKAFARRRSAYTQRWEELVAHRFPDVSAPDVAATTQAALGMVFSVAGWPGRVVADDAVEALLVELVSGALLAVARRSAS